MDTQNFNNDYAEPAKQTNGMAIASLVVSIVSLLLGCCCSGYIGIVGGIVGLVLGIMANKKGKTGMATAGIIISIVALVLSVASVVISLVFADALKEYMEKAGYPM